MSVILDAGPILNFLATSQQGVLLRLAEQNGLRLTAPEQVQKEVLDKAASDPRFTRTPVVSTWRKLTSSHRVEILSDDLTDDTFEQAIGRVAGLPAASRIRDRRSLGEILAIAHASVLAQSGQDVFVLIDDGDGRHRASVEIERLTADRSSGTVTLWSSRQVLLHADREGWLPDPMGTIYNRMRRFDDGLPPLR